MKTNQASEVIQSDREAAAANIVQRRIAMHGGEQPWMDASTASMRLGEQDDHSGAQAFARHRLAHTPAPASDDREGLVERLRQSAERDRHLDWFHVSHADLLTITEALSTPKPATSEVERLTSALVNLMGAIQGDPKISLADACRAAVRILSVKVHKGWAIEGSNMFGWQATHPSFDGDEDRRYVTANTRLDLIDEIEEFIAENNNA